MAHHSTYLLETLHWIGIQLGTAALEWDSPCSWGCYWIQVGDGPSSPSLYQNLALFVGFIFFLRPVPHPYGTHLAKWGPFSICLLPCSCFTGHL